MRYFHKHQPEQCVLCHSTDSIIISKGAFICAHCYLKSIYKYHNKLRGYPRSKVIFLVKQYINQDE
ncbi:hypothetical protein ASL14_01805 [Paenibacillus sp. IHB B 3084]|nr:hypothetical protein ASL14_01805 [Paenibacillus sp. IHB B 3084]